MSYAGIAKIALIQTALSGASILRLKGWELPLIVCQDVKEILEGLGTSGITYQELVVIG